MNQSQKWAVVTKLVRSLRDVQSWCGETHLQKAMFFLQTLLNVPTDYDFILYKHGPFSFDFRDELAELLSSKLLQLDPQTPYGPKWGCSDSCNRLWERCPKTLEKYSASIQFVSEKLGVLGVVELERLGTALYVYLRANKGASDADLTQEIRRLKPHIKLSEARFAVRELRGIARDATPLVAQVTSQVP